MAPAAGPIMKTSSVAMASRAKAVRRCSPSASTPRDWRTTLKMGRVEQASDEHQRQQHTRRTRAARSDQMTVSETTDGMSAFRSPTVSTRRPRHGAPDGNADGHDGGGCAGGRVALAQGQDDVQGQQARRPPSAVCGRSCRPTGAAGWAGRPAAPGKARSSRTTSFWYCRGSTGKSPRWTVSYGAARCSLTSIESTRSAKNSFRAQALLRPATMDWTPAASSPSSR